MIRMGKFFRHKGVKLRYSSHTFSFCVNFQEKYRTDCNLAVQLLQCKPSNFVAQKLSHVSILSSTVKPVLSDHIKQDIHVLLAFQTDGCLLLHESSAESSCMSFLHYFHSAISNHLSIAISMSHKWMVA